VRDGHETNVIGGEPVTPGDLIKAVNGVPVTNPAEVMRELSKCELGKDVKLEVESYDPNESTSSRNSWRPTKFNKKPPKALAKKNKAMKKELAKIPQMRYHDAKSAEAEGRRVREGRTADDDLAFCCLFLCFCGMGAATAPVVDI